MVVFSDSWVGKRITAVPARLILALRQDAVVRVTIQENNSRTLLGRLGKEMRGTWARSQASAFSATCQMMNIKGEHEHVRVITQIRILSAIVNHTSGLFVPQ